MTMSFSQESPSRQNLFDSFGPSIFEVSPATQAHVRGFGLPSTGPLSVPTYTHGSIFWGSVQSSQETMTPISANRNSTATMVDQQESMSFLLTPKTDVNTPRLMHSGSEHTRSSRESRHSSVHNLHDLPPLNTQNLEIQASSASSAIMSSDSVDPSMLFKFPPAPRSPQSLDGHPPRVPIDGRRRANFEHGGQTIRAPKSKGRPCILPAAKSAAGQDRSKLQRAVSETLMKRPSLSHAYRFTDRRGLLDEDSMPPSVRRASPYKRQKTGQMDALVEEHRQSTRRDVTFSIGDDGVARVEPIVIPDPKSAKSSGHDGDVNMEYSSSSTSSEEDQENNPAAVGSRDAPFRRNYYPPSAFPNSMKYKSLSSPIKPPPKNGGLTIGPRSGSRLAQLVPRAPPTQIYQDPVTNNQMGDSEAETTIDDGDDIEPGNALDAITKLRRRGGTRKAQADAMDTASISFSGTASYAHSYANSLDQLSAFNGAMAMATASATDRSMMDFSPTTVTDPDVATPSTDRTSNTTTTTEGETRCVCNSEVGKGGVLILCESCAKWLHSGCVGIEAVDVPERFVCPFCLKMPSKRVRGGR